MTTVFSRSASPYDLYICGDIFVNVGESVIFFNFGGKVLQNGCLMLDFWMYIWTPKYMIRFLKVLSTVHLLLTPGEVVECSVLWEIRLFI